MDSGEDTVGKDRGCGTQGSADIVEGADGEKLELAQVLADVEIPDGLGERFEVLAKVMAKLRSPDGCPWDLEQTPESLSRHMLEEAYETVEAIDSADWAHVAEELGDLMLQIVFQAQVASESDRFDLADVVVGISEKLERRHPHIFGEVTVEDARQVAVNWDRIKKEQEGKGAGMRMPSGLPAMMAALKVQHYAARDGFDWTEAEGVLSKLDEEIEELEETRRSGDTDGVEREVGDILFTVVNLSRHLGVDPERALRRSAAEFARRYSEMEGSAERSGKELSEVSLEEKERLWQAAKE